MNYSISVTTQEWKIYDVKAASPEEAIKILFINKINELIEEIKICYVDKKAYEMHSNIKIENITVKRFEKGE